MNENVCGIHFNRSICSKMQKLIYKERSKSNYLISDDNNGHSIILNFQKICVKLSKLIFPHNSLQIFPFPTTSIRKFHDIVFTRDVTNIDIGTGIEGFRLFISTVDYE